MCGIRGESTLNPELATLAGAHSAWVTEFTRGEVQDELLDSPRVYRGSASYHSVGSSSRTGAAGLFRLVASRFFPRLPPGRDDRGVA